LLSDAYNSLRIDAKLRPVLLFYELE